MFQDRRVRQALAMLWDFEWSNRQMMRNMYIRQQSFFSNRPRCGNCRMPAS
jgi:microcin C transport system substrate-binding protein